VVPEGGVPGTIRLFRESLLARPEAWHATLAYGQPAPGPGLHVMQSPTETPAEVVTGLAGTGAEIMIAHAGDAPLESHPMVPMIQTGTVGDAPHANDLDLLLDPCATTTALLQALGTSVADVASRRYRPKLFASGITSFQLTRGLLGLSM
jgi:hypothetical protein